MNVFLMTHQKGSLSLLYYLIHSIKCKSVPQLPRENDIVQFVKFLLLKFEIILFQNHLVLSKKSTFAINFSNL